MREVWADAEAIPRRPCRAEVIRHDLFLTEDEIVERYAGRSHRDLSRFGFYLGLAPYMLAAVLNGIQYRHLHGQTVAHNARFGILLARTDPEVSKHAGLSYFLCRPEQVEMTGRDAGYRYQRAKGDSIEGCTSEILRNIVAERVLGLPPSPGSTRACRGKRSADEETSRPARWT
jgi:hypothetical protein